MLVLSGLAGRFRRYGQHRWTFLTLATYRAFHRCSRWSGTIADLLATVRLALEMLDEMPLPPQRDDEERDTSAWCRAEIVMSDLNIDVDGLPNIQSELDGLPLRRIRRIKVEVRRPYLSVDVWIEAERAAPALEVRMSGDNRTEVEGIRSRLGSSVDHGKARFGGQAGLAWLIGLLISASLIGGAVLLDRITGIKGKTLSLWAMMARSW
jgi:hypothetical protein